MLESEKTNDRASYAPYQTVNLVQHVRKSFKYNITIHFQNYKANPLSQKKPA